MSIKNLNNLLKNNNGAALFLALMMLTAILTISLGAANLVFSGIKRGQLQSESTKSYFAAETGAERVLWEIRKNGFDPSVTCNSSTVNVSFSPTGCQSSPIIYNLVNGAFYKVIYDDSGAPNNIIFKSIGTYKGVERAIEINYEPSN
jgi:Tfp pilus assembly protein PilX